MWSPDRRALLAGLGLAALSGCGFRPVHGDGGGDALRGRVALDLPPGRVGHALREALERRLGRAGPGADWTLAVTMGFDSEGVAITSDSAITRYVLRGEAPWTLTGPEGPALDGRARSMSAHSADGSLYASRAAARDAEERVAADLGERIAARIAVALASGELASGELAAE